MKAPAQFRYGRFGLLYKLSDEDRVALCQEIAEACEQSFRRGFQQGYEGAGDVVVDVLHWRFNTSLRKSPSPHGTYSSTALDRHRMEVGLPCRVLEPETQPCSHATAPGGRIRP